MTLKPTALLVFVLATALIMAACNTTNTSQTTPTSSDAPAMAQESTQPADGETPPTQVAEQPKTVSAEGTYQSPAGQEEVGFTIIVDAEGVITDAEAEVKATNPTSVIRQTSFAEAFPTALVGKKLTDLSNVDRIGGSSLTTGAFNRALAELKAQL